MPEKKYTGFWYKIDKYYYIAEEITMSTEDMQKYRAIILESQQLSENLHWDTQHDAEAFMSCRSLIKNNNGVWKSIKQRDFLMKTLFGTAKEANAKENFGIDLVDGERICKAEGRAQWSEYGGRGIRPVGYAFVADDQGIVRQYKLRYKEVPMGKDRYGRPSFGMRINPQKTELEWSRSGEVDTSHLVPPPAEAKPAAPQGKHIGTPGERIRDLPVKVEKVMGPYSGEFGAYYANKLRDQAGNALLYFGKALGEPGTDVRATFTVGRHETDKHTNEPITTMKRPIIK